MVTQSANMSRSVSWRRLCSEAVSKRIDEALQSVVYIINQAGPTGFVLKQGESKFKVYLGDVHTCTCSVFKKEKELCIHILWLLLKRFRIPKTNAVVFQLGLVEREINEVLRGHLIQQSPTSTDGSQELLLPSGSCDQRPISLDDVCPICQNDLLSKPQRYSYCKYGCGKSVHLKCIKVWAEHQKSQGGRSIHCPMCREKFSTFEELNKELYSKVHRSTTQTVKESLHYGVGCSQCQVCPIAGKCYKCTSCPNFYLCHSCFVANHHSTHLFHFQQYPGHIWRPAIRTETASHRSSSLPQSLVNDLQSRELNANDYNLLLQLDASNSAAATHNASAGENSLAVHFRTEPLDHNNPLLISGAICQLCSELFQRGDWIRKLPCKHKFHRNCIDIWLSQEGHSTCPVDGRSLCDPPADRQSRRLHHTINSTGTRRTGHIYSRQDSSTSPPLREEIGMLVSGHGLSIKGEVYRSHSTIPHVRPSLVGIRKGSALQRNSTDTQNTAYINLHITPLSNFLSSSPSLHRDPFLTAGSRRVASLDANCVEKRLRPSAIVQHGPVITNFMIKSKTENDRQRQRKLPLIAPTNKVEINSLLQVSSLSTSLPPIITNHHYH